MAANRRPTPPDADAPAGGSFEVLDADYLAADSASFVDLDLSRRSGTGELRRVSMTGVDLSGSQLRSLSLINTRFTQVDLSNATLNEVTANRAEWRDCRAVGLGVAFTTATDLLIIDCVLNYARVEFVRARPRIVLAGCSLRESMISGDLTGVVFDDCDITETEFRATRASNCDLRTSRLTAPRGLSTLRGARVTAAQTLGIAENLAVEAGLVID